MHGKSRLELMYLPLLVLILLPQLGILVTSHYRLIHELCLLGLHSENLVKELLSLERRFQQLLLQVVDHFELGDVLLFVKLQALL